MPGSSYHHLESEICSFISSLIGHPCAPQDDLKSIGVDSIALLEVVIFIEKRLSIPLPLELLTDGPISSVAALTTRLSSLHPQEPSTTA
jgi:acyl carrier protein